MEKTATKDMRKSNIELLRIISILLIISFHYVYKNDSILKDVNFTFFSIKTFYFFGELGVNLFILIMGYFNFKNKFSAKKLILLLAEVLFYHMVYMIIGLNVGAFTFGTSFNKLFLSFFPIIQNSYWFITVYLLVYIISPYFNMLISHMDKKTYQKFLCIALFLWCILPTFFGIFSNSSENNLYYNRFIWFIIMYFVGAYIHLYPVKAFDDIKKSILISFLSFSMMIAGMLIILKFSGFFKNLGTTQIAYFWTPNNILMFILSISIFSIFLKIDIGTNKIINKFASTTLGIYILHDGILYYYIWKKVFRVNHYLLGNHPIIHILFTTITIFLVGSFIDFIRQFIEKYTIKKFLQSNSYQKICNDASNEFNKLLDKI